MDMPKNRFKQRMAENQLQLGLFLGLANSISTEILAGCGFDFLLIDAEHSPNDLRSIQAQLQTIAAYPVSAMVRPPNHDTSFIKQLLAIGTQTLLIPMVETPQQARDLVAAVRYPPLGVRGVGIALERSARWTNIPDYFAQVAEQTCLIIQIESLLGIQNLDEILAIEGLDAVFLGPTDLAASMGYLNQSHHPEVQDAITQALQQIHAAKKAAGIFSSDPALAKQYQANGVKFIALGADTLLLRNAALQLRQVFEH